MEEVTIKQLKETAKELRKTALTMIYKVQSGHPGGSMSAADPSFAPYANAATAQCSAACVVTAILCPLIVAFLDKRIRRKIGNQ